MNTLQQVQVRRMLSKIQRLMGEALESEVFNTNESPDTIIRERLKKAARDSIRSLVGEADMAQVDLDVVYSGDGPCASKNYQIVPRNLYTAVILMVGRPPTMKVPEEGEILAAGTGLVRYDHDKGGTFVPDRAVERVSFGFNFHLSAELRGQSQVREDVEVVPPYPADHVDVLRPLCSDNESYPILRNIPEQTREAVCSCNACGKPLTALPGQEMPRMICWRCALVQEVKCEECLHLIEYEDEDKWPHGCGRCGRSREELLKWQKRLIGG